MRNLIVVIAALLAMVLVGGCGNDTASTEGGTQLEETTSGTTAMVVSEKTAPENTVEPAGWEIAIGDSVMIGAVDALEQSIPNLALIDAQGSRQFPAAVDVLRRRRAAGQLGDGVIVHIGNNGPFSAEQFDEMMQELEDVRKVLVVNLTVPTDVEDPIAVPNDTMLAEGVKRYPNAELVDWRAASAGHPEFFSDNGIHLSAEGARAYAELIAAHLGSLDSAGTPPGPRERITWGEGGFFGECIGPPSWCAAG